MKKNDEELREMIEKLNKKYQNTQNKATDLMGKMLMAEQHATFLNCFIDKLLAENRIIVDEIKELRKNYEFKTKHQLIRDVGKERPHYKSWR